MTPMHTPINPELQAYIDGLPRQDRQFAATLAHWLDLDPTQATEHAEAVRISAGVSTRRARAITNQITTIRNR